MGLKNRISALSTESPVTCLSAHFNCLKLFYQLFYNSFSIYYFYFSIRSLLLLIFAIDYLGKDLLKSAIDESIEHLCKAWKVGSFTSY